MISNSRSPFTCIFSSSLRLFFLPYTLLLLLLFSSSHSTNHVALQRPTLQRCNASIPFHRTTTTSTISTIYLPLCPSRKTCASFFRKVVAFFSHWSQSGRAVARSICLAIRDNTTTATLTLGCSNEKRRRPISQAICCTSCWRRIIANQFCRRRPRAQQSFRRSASHSGWCEGFHR